jgi:hypothetical protein
LRQKLSLHYFFGKGLHFITVSKNKKLPIKTISYENFAIWHAF